MSSFETNKEFIPPNKIDSLYSVTLGNNFAAINAPTAGAREQKELPEGSAPFQLYSLSTPNGQKVGILLEELGIDYDAHVINIGKGEQFTSGFVAVNPNSKIPAAVDKDGPNGQRVNLFESGSILLYLAEKYNRFIPSDPLLRAQVINWLFWQVGGQGPITGNFGHFFVYAPKDKIEAREYGISRFGMEVERLVDVLEKHLSSGRSYLVGDEYTLADIAIFPWFNQLRVGYKHSSGIAAKEFLSIDKYVHTNAWADRILAREQVKRGITVAHFSDGPKPWLNKKEE
eukprot:gene17637-23215_t